MVSMFGRTPLWVFLAHAVLVHALAMTTSSVPQSSDLTTTHYHIRFDGCFRPPKDTGFPTISQRMAVCACCIGRVSPSWKERDPDQNDDNDLKTKIVPLAVSARELPVSIETTSQHAEYEGLLMGLEWLVEFIASQNRKEQTDDCSNEADTSERVDLQAAEMIELTIEGDCKTVIDQLNGKSNPRKLEVLYDRAVGFLDKLRSTSMAVSDIDSTTTHSFCVDICHIPRSENSVSDALCNNWMSILGAKSWLDNIRELERFETRILQPETLESLDPSHLKLSDTLGRILQNTKYSLRLPLYEMVAKLALETEHYDLLIQIGERMLDEESSLEGRANSNPSSSSTATTMPEITATEIRTAGVGYQIKGWEGLTKAKKIKFLQRKHRVLFSKNGHDCATYIQNLGKTRQFIPSMEDQNLELSIHRQLEPLGDVTHGEWDSVSPNVWKPMLDQWFNSARYESSKKLEEDVFAPIWVVDTSAE